MDFHPIAIPTRTTRTRTLGPDAEGRLRGRAVPRHEASERLRFRAVLRPQLAVLGRQVSRPRYERDDRAFPAALSRAVNQVLVITPRATSSVSSLAYSEEVRQPPEDSSAGEAKRPARSRYVPALRFHALTPLYDPLIALTTREGRFKRRLLDQARLESGQWVLDVGCGTGTLAIEANQEQPGAVVTGLDGDRAVLDRAARKATDKGAVVVLTEGFSDALPFHDGSFDRVLSTLFFHHLTLDTKRRTFAELARVLRRGGELHVADWGRPETFLMRLLSAPLRLFDGLEHTRDNLQGRLPALMRDAGLIDVCTLGGLSTAFGTMAFYRAVAPR